jgi:cytochrome c biogenesis protein CcdA
MTTDEIAFIAGFALICAVAGFAATMIAAHFRRGRHYSEARRLAGVDEAVKRGRR